MSEVKSRRELYSEATRAALLDAATELFAERGFAGTTLEGVASVARVTRGAVYHHFAGKTALFEAVLERMELGVIEKVTESAERAEDPLAGALAALDTFLRECCDPLYTRLAWQEGPVALGWNRWVELEEYYAYGITERLVRGLVEAGYIRDVPLGTTARFAFSLLGAAGRELMEADEADKTRVKNECGALLRRFLAGLLTGGAEVAGQAGFTAGRA
ncbi:TetR/AcrR family transcriptional regulator [Amycolatopsis aidingensis]|uniref:TetR/AcrR family transcriptional regulator n=1 Tax=Amycolatopsis aidingensis TaxID=2842453 RepID=UPI001C0D6A07|nr:TetR/AcrR family transcriptional regulator [Amycolatopsis aidingensis]